MNKQIVRSIVGFDCIFSLIGNQQVCMEYQDITPSNEREIFQVCLLSAPHKAILHLRPESTTGDGPNTRRFALAWVINIMR